MVEIRDAADATSATHDTKIGRQVAFLMNDGSVVGLDGNSHPLFICSPVDQLFITIYHRNHLSVMSAFPLIESAGIYSYDFSSGSDQAFGGNLAHKEIAPGIWGMVAGDGNSDGLVNMEDKLNFWSLFAGNKGYLTGDYNLDVNINNQDKNDLWRSNLNWETQLPE